MKKLFFAICALIIIGAVALMCYGGYLNYTSEKNIAMQISNKEITLEGVRARLKTVQAVHQVKHLYLSPYRKTDVVARQAGTITKILVKKYETIQKGQIVGIMESKELEAQAAEVEASLSKAITSRDRNRLSYERYGQLVRQGAVSMEQFDDARAAYEGSVSEVKSLEAQKAAVKVRLDQLILRSPIDGYVNTFYKEENSYVGASYPVMLVLNTKSMIHTEDLQEEDFRALFPLPDHWTLYLDAANYTNLFANTEQQEANFDKGFNALIESIVPPPGEPATMRSVTWKIANPDELLYNLHYKDTRFVSSQKHEGTVVPAKAVDTNSGEIYVWGKNNLPELRKVKLGVNMGEWVEILQGVAPNELVILNDPILFKLAKDFKFHIREVTAHEQ